MTSRYFHTRHKYPPPTFKTTFPFTSSRKFTNFSKLPTELRLKIWRHCLPKPRAIVIYTKHLDWDDSGRRVIRYHSSKPHPTILAVNRESRNEALNFYIMIHGPNNYCLAFDNDRDTIYSMTPPSEWIHGDLSLKLFEDPMFECLAIGRGQDAVFHNDVRIKSLAVNEADLKNSGMARQYLELDELIIVLPSSLGFRRSDIGGGAQVPSLILRGPPHLERGEAQQKILREVEKCVRRELEEENKGKEIKLPVIKVVRWGTLRTEEDFFCVHVTPLSLRKDHL